MIRDYANHAANERTFLAWVRTGIAIIALGFVIEKFNLFLLTVAKTLAAEAPYPLQLRGLSGPVGRFGGLALILGGVALIFLSALRFVRTERLLAAEEMHPASALRMEFALLTATVLFVAGISAYAALG
jgi:putative membrane protein